MTLCDGEDMLLYSSDWPHATFDPLNWVFETPISEAGRKKILRDNAINWFKRPVATCVPSIRLHGFSAPPGDQRQGTLESFGF